LRSTPLSTGSVWGGERNHRGPLFWISCHAASSSSPSYPIAMSLGSASSLFMPPNLTARALTSSRVMVREPLLDASAALSSLSRTEVSDPLRSTPLSTGSVWGGERNQAGPEIWSHTASSSSPS